MRDAPMNESLSAEESRLIAEAHAAVLIQTQKNVFEPAPYELATQLLESLPTSQIVDNRVQLALDITVATRNDYRPDLSRRALYAAFPAGSRLEDLRLERKWFTFAGLIEANIGNIDRALKYKLIALDVCKRLQDATGFHIEWSNLAGLATGAGLYQDAVDYSTVAIEGKGDYELALLNVRSIAFLSRGNALYRLGRLAEAVSDLSSCLMLVTFPPDASAQNRMLLAQYIFAEIQLDYGNRSTAREALNAASTWADASGLSQHKLQIERVRARLSAFECSVEHAVLNLQRLLIQAYDIEATLGGASLESAVTDVLYTLERVCREHGDIDAANKWLNAIGQKLRTNATKMLDALADKSLVADDVNIAAKFSEIDEYLQSRTTARPGTFGAVASSWSYLVGLAASASGVEDPTKEHGVRVARLASLVAVDLGLPCALRRGIEAGCLVHDVGKVSVPVSILMKQTPLDAAELQLYDAHSNIGTELLERVKLPEASIVRNLIRFHHHPYHGGTVYPAAKGEAIPIEARIAAVCDRYDSLVTGRPRRPAVHSADALQGIFEQRGRDFDPNLVDVVIEIVRRLQRTHSDVQAYLSEEAAGIEYFAMRRTLKKAAARAFADYETAS